MFVAYFKKWWNSLAHCIIFPISPLRSFYLNLSLLVPCWLLKNRGWNKAPTDTAVWAVQCTLTVHSAHSQCTLTVHTHSAQNWDTHWEFCYDWSTGHWPLAQIWGRHCTVYSVQRTVYSEHCKVYSVQCTVYSEHCKVYSVQCTVNTVQCTVYTVHCSVHCMCCTV